MKFIQHFKDSPVISMVTYTIFIMGAVFAYSKFVLIENIETEYRVQLEIQGRTIEQYQARIDFIQKENSVLGEDNKRYLEWLQNIPGNVAYFENQVNQLTETNKNLQQLVEPEPLDKKTDKYEFYSDNVKQNQSITDKHTGIVVCVFNIDRDYTADLNITYPNSETKLHTKINAGQVYPYTDENGVSYRVCIVGIDWVSSRYMISILEQ